MGATQEKLQHPHSVQRVACIKWLRHEVNLSPPSNAKVKNEWSYTSTSPICLHGADRGIFTLCSIMCVSKMLCIKSIWWTVHQSQQIQKGLQNGVFSKWYIQYKIVVNIILLSGIFMIFLSHLLNHELAVNRKC